MKKDEKISIIDGLAQVLKNDKKASALIKKNRVKLEVYAAYVYDSELDKAKKASYLIGGAITLILGVVSMMSAIDLDLGIGGIVLVTASGAALGLFIAYSAKRMMDGKQSKYVVHPGETSSGMSLIGVLNRLSYKEILKTAETTWSDIRMFNPDLTDDRYMRFPTEDRMADERKKMAAMTPEKEEFIRKIRSFQRIVLFAMPLGAISFFIDSPLFFWMTLLFGGIWFGIEGLVGFIEKKVGFFESGEGEVHGWPAQVSAVVIMMVAILLGILPGILGMAEALGYRLI